LVDYFGSGQDFLGDPWVWFNEICSSLSSSGSSDRFLVLEAIVLLVDSSCLSCCRRELYLSGTSLGYLYIVSL